MATTESNPAAPAPASAAEGTKSPEKQEKLSKVEKPDEEKFKKDLAEADKQLSSIQEKMVDTPNLQSHPNSNFTLQSQFFYFRLLMIFLL